MKKMRNFSRRYATGEDAARGALLNTYKTSAIKRELLFELSDEQFFELTRQDCWYCGVGPSQICYADNSRKQRLISDRYCFYNGVDRRDNATGYDISNCVPCCSKCNRMKMTMSVEDFLRRVKHIAQHLGLV